jgi:integrase
VQDVPVPLFLQEAIVRHVSDLGLTDGGVLCRTPRQTLLRRDYYNREIWTPALAAAELPADATFHDLRHPCSTRRFAANLNPKVIQARLGHATITETMDTYGHLFPDAEDLGRGAIDGVLAALKKSLPDLERTQEAL